MEQPQNTIPSNDILTSIAGILFFGPIIARTKKSVLNEWETVMQNNLFTQGYCKVWKLNLTLFVITFIMFIIDYFFPSQLLNRMIIFAAGAICILSAFSIFSCLNEVQLFTANESLQASIPHKEMIIKSFIPIYNIKLRYQTPNFQLPYRRAKESILRRTIFSFFTLLWGIQVGKLMLALIFIRLLLLLVNIDLIPNNLKKFLNRWFLMHPEEIIHNLIHKYLPKVDGDASHFNTALQYVTFTALLRLIRRNATISYDLIIPLLALFAFIAKILLTYWKYNKFPNIPILYELWSLVLK